MKLLERFRADAKAVKMLSEWLGDGGEAVHSDISQRRADTCFVSPKRTNCQALEASAAEAIMNLMDLKRQIGLRVAGESQLRCCAACGCYLPLKVQMPLDKILKETDDAERAKLDPRCWILNETPEMKTT